MSNNTEISLADVLASPLTPSNYKRGAEAELTDRQLPCPPGLHCGHGPECTPATCDLPGCADAEVCQGYRDEKRSAESGITHPICDICIVGENGVPVCGCAVPGGGPERRGLERVCPQFCIVTEDGKTVCGCAAEDYEDSSRGSRRAA